MSPHDNQTVLTIAVPTFNRPTDLLRTVGSLTEQLDERTELLIIDNCSEEPAEKILAEFLNRGQRVRVIRNRLNVGANANILRCIEYADSPYVWVLSDDDLPVAGCVDIVHRHLREKPDCAYWKFSSAYHPFCQCVDASTPKVYLNSVGTLQEAIWISNGVFNRNELGRYYPIASHWLSSCSAHLLLVLLGLEDGRHAVLSMDKIVEFKMPVGVQKADRATIFAGLPLLLDAPLQWGTKQLLGRLIGDMFGSPESLALWISQTPAGIWNSREKAYHYRNLGNAIYRSFGDKSVGWKYGFVERCLPLIEMAGYVDRAVTGGKFLGRPGLSQPAGRTRL